MTGLPYDGRDRRAPERTSGISPEDFQAQLVETVVTTAMEHMKRPFVIPDHYDQTQARLYHATSMKYFSFFAWRFPSWLLEIASRCPYQDVRREIIQDCVDEEVGDEDANGRCHVDVLYDETEACGVAREDVAATPRPRFCTPASWLWTTLPGRCPGRRPTPQSPGWRLSIPNLQWSCE